MVILCMLRAPYSAATEPELTFIATAGWVPAGGLIAAGTVQAQHDDWHGNFGLGDGKDFVEFHREFLAQFDDYRLYGTDPAGDPWPAIVPQVAGAAVKPTHANLNGYSRPVNHVLEVAHPHAGGGIRSEWVRRPEQLKLGNAAFHALADAQAVGERLEQLTLPAGTEISFHGNGHGTIARHDENGTGMGGDMGNTLDATRDGVFFQWHKNVDNIFADWAVGRYRKADNSGLPHFFSVIATATGSAGSRLRERTVSDVYRGGGGGGSQFGGRPRIASDIYVGDQDGKNLLFQYGIRKWSAPPQDATKYWDVDAYSTLNPPRSGWYFSVTSASAGKPGTAVNGEAQRGGDVFTSPEDMTNALHRTETNLGLSAAASDDLDALEVDEQRRLQATNDDGQPGIYDRPKHFFSLRAGSTHGVQATSGGTTTAVVPGDILHFASDGRLTIVVPHGDLGLQAGDEVDALALVDVNANDQLDAGDEIYFSLAAGSPTLGTDSAADVFLATKGVAGKAVAVTADALGLLATDDVDAVDVRTATPAGACCLPDGTCQDTTALGCTGAYAGDGTGCDRVSCPSAPGTCCHADGNCEEGITDVQCLEAGGAFAGEGNLCGSTQCPAPPPNDACPSADSLQPYQIVDTTYATSHEEDPPYGCAGHEVFFPPFGSGTVWYQFVATDSLLVLQSRALLSEDEPAGATRLAVYTGGCGGLTEIGCAEAESLEDEATVVLENLVVGETYYVQLATIGNANRGRLSLEATRPLLDHFQCYETPREPFTAIAGVSLDDRFGASTVDVIRPKRLCNPADVNERDPTAPTHPDHLTAYAIKQRTPFTKRSGVEVMNQFGTITVDVTKPEMLLVPTAKSLIQDPAPPLIDPAVDHFKCYRVRRAKQRVSGLRADDQFGSLIEDVKRPLRLCVPASKNGSMIHNPLDHLMCYKVRQTNLPRFRGVAPIFINNQFGASTIAVDHVRELCVPSTVGGLDACTAAGITLPNVLPDQMACAGAAPANCNGWEFVGRFEQADLADFGPAHFYEWISGNTTCWYLERFQEGAGGKHEDTSNGVHCYNRQNCSVCAFDLMGATPPPKWHMLKRADQGIQDCSQCHAAGPVTPIDGFWRPARKKTASIMRTCASLGGPRWIGAPSPPWQPQSTARRVPAPPPAVDPLAEGLKQEGCTKQGCHSTGFVKDASMFCGAIVEPTFDATGSGSMGSNGYSFTDKAVCEAFATAMGCTPAQLDCPS